MVEKLQKTLRFVYQIAMPIGYFSKSEFMPCFEGCLSPEPSENFEHTLNETVLFENSINRSLSGSLTFTE